MRNDLRGISAEWQGNYLERTAEKGTLETLNSCSAKKEAQGPIIVAINSREIPNIGRTQKIGTVKIMKKPYLSKVGWEKIANSTSIKVKYQCIID